MLNYLQFRFHTGSIKSPTLIDMRLLYLQSFDSILVRLKESTLLQVNCKTINQVSIPYWFD